MRISPLPLPLHRITRGAYARLPIPAQNLACSIGGRRAARARFTPHFRASLAAWRELPTWSPERVAAEQWRRLHAQLERARRTTPHYAAYPPPAEPIDTPDPGRALVATLASLPTIEKAELRADPDAFVASDVAPDERVGAKTSGTTGSSMRLLHTRALLAEEFACVWRQRLAAGVEPGEPNLTFNGRLLVPFGQRRPPFWRVNRPGRQTLFSVFHLTARNARAYTDAVHDTVAAGATFVQGYPSAIHWLAREMLTDDRALASGALKAVFTSSESLRPPQRETIAAAFGAPVYDRYGTTELCVSMTECTAGRLHPDPGFCAVEVDVEQRTDAWERGPLVVTGLGSAATILLRYRIGDIGTRARDACPCGRIGPSFLSVDGRLEDDVVTPDGRSIGRLDHVFKATPTIDAAQIRQDRADALDVLVVWRHGADEVTRAELVANLRSRVGPDMEIAVRDVDALPRGSNGKVRAVVSNLTGATP